MPDVVRPINNQDGQLSGYEYWCFSCRQTHWIPTEEASGHKLWSFNRNMTHPTFGPSIKITAPPSKYCCHHHVTDGRIEYCGDCHHNFSGRDAQEFAGKTIDMQPIPPGDG